MLKEPKEFRVSISAIERLVLRIPLLSVEIEDVGNTEIVLLSV